jgi:hypothetical protein
VKRVNLTGLKLGPGKGAAAGDSGFEGVWRKLCEGKAADVDSLAHRFDQYLQQVRVVLCCESWP